MGWTDPAAWSGHVMAARNRRHECGPASSVSVGSRAQPTAGQDGAGHLAEADPAATGPGAQALIVTSSPSSRKARLARRQGDRLAAVPGQLEQRAALAGLGAADRCRRRTGRRCAGWRR